MKSLFLISTLLTSFTGCLVEQNSNHIKLTSQSNSVIENLTLPYKNQDTKPEQITYFNYLVSLQNSSFLSTLQNNITAKVDLTNYQYCKFFNPNAYKEFTNYNSQQATHQYQVALVAAITNVFLKVMIVSMISDIANYYINSENSYKNEIISNNINIIKSLINDIKQENDSQFEHSLFNKNGIFLIKLDSLNLNQMIANYQNGKVNKELTKFDNINYNVNGFTVDNTVCLTQVMSNALNEASSHGGLGGNAQTADTYLLNLDTFNLSLTFTIEVFCNYFSPPTPWDVPPQSPQIFFRFILPSLFDLNLN